MNARVALLQAVFAEIADTRMAGLPLFNPLLAVEAIDFEPLHAEATGAAALGRCAMGVLVTPWFMNLVCLPLQRLEAPALVGRVQRRQLAGRDIDFIVGHEPTLGAFSACSLFSPMHDFADAAGARATAMAVLELLREPASAPVSARSLAQPARRGFLFGRHGGQGAAA
jgi:[NiFe] hydrogenase assembly HybE family chaperone